jgi:hypothetical protein
VPNLDCTELLKAMRLSPHLQSIAVAQWEGQPVLLYELVVR